MEAERKPILFLDVDGAVCAYGKPPGCEMRRIWGLEVPIDPKNHARLTKLHELFEIIWCTDWEENANLVGEVFGLPELRHVPRERDLPPRPTDEDELYEDPDDPFAKPGDFDDGLGLGSPSMYRKIPSVRKYRSANDLESMPFAWVDDHINANARRFASELRAATLLIRTRRDVGLTDEILAQLELFAGAVRAT
ncbi:MAG: hypothetical protein HY827_00350 [Actinobacteria bacterium]|nr:hypothetical protein [Actinomycetota bacterium]